eukprot:355034-Chlamydomonas_euryale.AAC.6
MQCVGMHAWAQCVSTGMLSEWASDLCPYPSKPVHTACNRAHVQGVCIGLRCANARGLPPPCHAHASSRTRPPEAMCAHASVLCAAMHWAVTRLQG